MDYKLIRSKRKTLAVCISDGQVTVKAPMSMSVAHIEQFLAQKSDWIQKKLTENAQKTIALAPLFDGSATLYHGTFVRLQPVYTAKIAVDRDVMYIPQKYTDKTSRDKAIARFFKKVAALELAQKLHTVSTYTGLDYTGFALTNARTQWGCCDGKCFIRLNWRLVMLDEEIMTYVIVHELSHTVHHDHSKQFWAQVQKLMPNYESVKKRLKTFSVLTSLYR